MHWVVPALQDLHLRLLHHPRALNWIKTMQHLPSCSKGFSANHNAFSQWVQWQQVWISLGNVATFKSVADQRILNSLLQWATLARMGRMTTGSSLLIHRRWLHRECKSEVSGLPFTLPVEVKCRSCIRTAFLRCWVLHVHSPHLQEKLSTFPNYYITLHYHSVLQLALLYMSMFSCHLEW